MPRAGRAQQELRAGEKPCCVSWQTVGTKGRWTSSGCTRAGGDALHSICTCTHFSTFAILVATHPIVVRSRLHPENTHLGGGTHDIFFLPERLRVAARRMGLA